MTSSRSADLSRFAWVMAGCLVTILAAACGKTEPAKKERPPALVTTATVVRQDTPYYLKAIGHVRALKSVDVKPRITGQLLSAAFKGGEYLEKGQLIFTVDPAPFEAALKEAQATLEQARARLKQAERDLTRFHAIYEAKGISSDEYEQKRLDRVWKEFQVVLEEARLTVAQLNLDYTRIHSPLDGQAGDILIDPPNTVSAYQSVLVNIRQIEPIRVEFSLPGKYLLEIMKYNEQKPLTVKVSMPGFDRPEEGVLYLCDNCVNPKTGMIMIQAKFPNAARRLWPGQFVNVWLELTVTKDAILVASPAVVVGPKGRYVWLVKPDSTVEMLPVLIDRSYDGMEVVAQGLSAGDRVVTEGQLLLYPGAKIVEQSAAAKPTSTANPPESEQKQTDGANWSGEAEP